jgi:tRNA(Ile)-lysidine synthase TilS/MesJ
MSVISRTPFVKVSSSPLLGDELYRRRDKGDLVPEKNPQFRLGRDSSFTKELTGTIFRPLLHTTKSDILAYAREHQVAYREDSTNTDTTYDRNRIRHDIIPVLESMNPSIHHTISGLTSYMQSLGDFLTESVESWLRKSELESGKPSTFLI